MDPALLRERELFKKRAAAQPVVEKRARDTDDSVSQPKKARRDGPSPGPSSGPSSSRPSASGMHSYRTATTSSSNFGALSKIVKSMKSRFLEGDSDALTLREILDDTNQLDATPALQKWLENEALVQNPKIIVSFDDMNGCNRYKYKPPYQIKDRKSLNRLLDNVASRGEGGIWLDDIYESLPNAEAHIKKLQDEGSVVIITRPDKRKVIFHNSKQEDQSIDEEFVKLWRAVSVEGVDESKIEEYLDKHGISWMQTDKAKGAPLVKRKKPTNRKNRNFKKHNEHMAGILEDYSDK